MSPFITRALKVKVRYSVMRYITLRYISSDVNKTF